MPKKKTDRPRFKGFSYDDASKPLINVAYFDGYHLGDRLLEGVSFKAEIGPDGLMTVAFVCPKGEYERCLNQRKWLKEALVFAEEYDVFNDASNLQGEDVTLEPIKPAPAKPSVVLPAPIPFTDIFKK